MTTQAGVTWGHGFRKQEQQRGVLSRIKREWLLEDWELMVNADVGRHLPTLMSSRFALAWVAERWSMAIFASNRTTSDYNAGWNRLLDGAQSTIAKVSSRPEVSGAATITAADVVLTVGLKPRLICRHSPGSGPACVMIGVRWHQIHVIICRHSTYGVCR